MHIIGSVLDAYNWSILKNMFFGKFTGLLHRKKIHPINLHQTQDMHINST